MRDLIKYKTQSVLVPKDQFHSEQEAKDHVRRLGYNADFKQHPHETQHFYRFRQAPPNKTHDYRTIKNKEGDLVVYETSNGDEKILHKNKFEPLHKAYDADPQNVQMDNKQFKVLQKFMPEQTRQIIKANILEHKQHAHDFKYHRPVLSNQPSILPYKKL